MPIRVSASQGWNRTSTYLTRLKNQDIFARLDQYGQMGVSALSQTTPIDTSETAHSWTYEIVRRKGYYSIVWRNTHIVNGVPIAIILQYGHGTRNGGYVQGRDYIMPAIKPVFALIDAAVRKVVTE